MEYGPLPSRQVLADPRPLTSGRCLPVVSSSIAPPFGGLSSCSGYVTHTLRTRSPRYYPSCPGIRARLAWVSHAASVRSEPGSNPSLYVRSAPAPLAEHQESVRGKAFDLYNRALPDPAGLVSGETRQNSRILLLSMWYASSRGSSSRFPRRNAETVSFGSPCPRPA